MNNNAAHWTHTTINNSQVVAQPTVSKELHFDPKKDLRNHSALTKRNTQNTILGRLCSIRSVCAFVSSCNVMILFYYFLSIPPQAEPQNKCMFCLLFHSDFLVARRSPPVSKKRQLSPAIAVEKRVVRSPPNKRKRVSFNKRNAGNDGAFYAI